MGPPTRDKQLSKALIEAAEKLLKLKLKPQSSTDATTLSLLNEMESLLAPVDPALSVRKKALARLKEALVSADLLRNPDSDVRVSVVSCLTKIMEVAALKAPFTHGQRKDIFQAIIEAFKILADASSRSYKKAEVVLETFSKPNSSLAMLALEYDDLVLEMFQRFLEIIRLPRDHSPLVLLSMETIMITVINKIKKVPMGLLDILLTTVKKESQSPAAVVLVENVLRRCTRNLQSCIMKALKSSGTSLDMYFPVVSSKCQSEFANTQAHNDVKPKENEADEKMSEGQVVPIESLEERLDKLGFKIIPMGRDGNCLFRALCHQFYGNQKFHGDIRRKIVEYMQANRELFEKSVDYLDHESYEAYCVRMSQDGTWGDHIQLQAAANITHTGIRVYRDYSRSNEIMPKLPNGRMINLSYHNGNHYNSVCPKDEDAIHQKTKVWWDYENAEIPAGMDHELALDWIVKKLEEYEFGQVELKLVVGYHDSPLPKFLSNIPIIFANKCTRSKKIVTKGNQAADVQIKDMLEEMYADETPTQLENHVFISGDCGYRDHITNLIGAGHRVMMISTGNLKDSRVLLQLKWSKVFGQPEVPIIKSLKESKQAAAKKARSRTHKKDLHKKSLEARQNVIANAKDENVKIPMCISLLHCGSVQFVLELVHHVQVPRITNINDICVSIHAPVAVDGEISRDVQEELARRLGRPLSTFTFQRVFGNRWNVVVKKKQVKKKQDVTCREVYVQLVSAIRPLI